MNNYTRKDILRMVEKEDVGYISRTELHLRATRGIS